jgi:hypothetical protein
MGGDLPRCLPWKGGELGARARWEATYLVRDALQRAHEAAQVHLAVAQLASACASQRKRSARWSRLPPSRHVRSSSAGFAGMEPCRAAMR